MNNHKKLKKRYIFSAIAVALVVSTVITVFASDKIWSELTGYGTPEINAETRQIVEAYADKNNISYRRYPNSLLELLERNPETEDFVLSYPFDKDNVYDIDLSEYKNSESVPLFLQWDKRWGYIEYGSDVAGLTACGPVCLSMCAVYLTGDEANSPDKMISFALDNGYYVEGSGSAWALISEGGEKLGLDVEELPLYEGRMIKSLEAGKPIICTMGPGHFTTSGHFIVIADYENGEFTVNDPNSRKNSERKWKYDEFSDEIKNLWSIGI